MDTKGKRNDKDFTKGILSSDLIDRLILPHLSPFDRQSLKLAHHKRLLGGTLNSQLPRDMGGITATRGDVEHFDYFQQDNPEGFFNVSVPDIPLPFGVVREDEAYFSTNKKRGPADSQINYRD